MRNAILRFLYKDKAGKLTPARAAKKLSQECLSICTGKYINQEKMEGLLNGEGAYWRKLKSTISSNTCYVLVMDRPILKPSQT